jgi:hypothetical protein
VKRVECTGMVGKYPTPKGLLMFWDTGRQITPVQLAEMFALQHSVFQTTGKQRQDAFNKIMSKATEMAQQVNVWPEGYAALTEDGRIFVTEPWFNEKEEDD